MKLDQRAILDGPPGPPLNPPVNQPPDAQRPLVPAVPRLTTSPQFRRLMRIDRDLHQMTQLEREAAIIYFSHMYGVAPQQLDTATPGDFPR